MPTLVESKTDKKLFLGLIITLGVSMLMPEYIAPLFVFGLYIYFIRHFKATNRNAKLGDIIKVFFIYIIYIVISSIWSATKLYSFGVAMLWMGCMLSGILVANIITSENKLKDSITAINISAGIIGLIAVLEFVTYNLTQHTSWFNFLFPNPFYWKVNDIIFDAMPFTIINYIFASRASATFDNPLILATYLVMTMPFCAFGSVYFNSSKHRKISRICLLFAFGGTIATGSRSSYIAIGLAIMVMIFSSKRLMKKLLPVAGVLVIGIPAGLMLRYKNLKIEDFLNSDSQRVNIWKTCIKVFADNPIFGIGPGTENVRNHLINDAGIERSHAHNTFLEMLVEGGVIGGIFVVAIIVMIVKSLVTIYKAKDKQYKYYGVLYTSSLIAFFIMSMTEFTLQSAKELMILFFVLGFIEATKRLATDTTQPAPDEIGYEKIEEANEDEKVAVEV